MLADKCPAGVAHAGDVDGAVEVIGEKAVEDGTVHVGPDQVAVAFAYGPRTSKSSGTSSMFRMRMSWGRRLLMAWRSRSVSSVVRRSSPRLAQGMDAGIGDGEEPLTVTGWLTNSPAAFSTVRWDGGGRRGLALPAAVGGAVVGDGEFVAFHCGNPTGTVRARVSPNHGRSCGREIR